MLVPAEPDFVSSISGFVHHVVQFACLVLGHFLEIPGLEGDIYRPILCGFPPAYCLVIARAGVCTWVVIGSSRHLGVLFFLFGSARICARVSRRESTFSFRRKRGHNRSTPYTSFVPYPPWLHRADSNRLICCLR